MNKKLTILYIIMILVGISMLFVIGSQSPSSNGGNASNGQETALPVQIKEHITVIEALHDLSAGSILTAADYQAKTIEVYEDSDDKNQYSLTYSNINEYGLNLSVKKGSYIPMSALVPPSASNDYIKMLLQEGMLVYPFLLTKTDQYLIDNMKSGDMIDIYLIYGAGGGNYGQRTVELISPSNNFLKTRMKPIIINRRLLRIQPPGGAENLVSGEETEGTVLFIELSQSEVKLVKSLEGNAKLFLFPSIGGADVGHSSEILVDDEAVWPVTDAQIFSTDSFNSSPVVNGDMDAPYGIKELRGN
jgi:pilus assembly protein CpaB